MTTESPPSPPLPALAAATTGTLAPPTPTVEPCLTDSSDDLPIAPPSRAASRESSMDGSGSSGSPPLDSPHRVKLQVPNGMEEEERDSFDGGVGGGGGGPAPKFMRDVDTASIAWPPPRDNVEQQQATRGGGRISTDPTHRYAPHAGNVRRTFSETVHDSLPHMPRIPRMSSGTRERCVWCGAWCTILAHKDLAVTPPPHTHTCPQAHVPARCLDGTPWFGPDQRLAVGQVA